MSVTPRVWSGREHKAAVTTVTKGGGGLTAVAVFTLLNHVGVRRGWDRVDGVGLGVGVGLPVSFARS